MKHYLCKKCGDLVAMVNGDGKRLCCCGSGMEELTPRWEGAGAEKHTPTLEQYGNRVHVWVPHPMDREHRIYWISLVTDKGSQRRLLFPGEDSSAEFYIGEDERVIRAFAFCNLHGLWALEIPDKSSSKE